MNKGNKTQYAILGALSIEPMSGYEIKKMMSETTNYFWTESNGQIYPTLAKLTSAKLVSCSNETVGAKPRNVYSLTKLGRKKLQQWLLSDPEYYPVRNELLLKLFYGQQMEPEISIRHIQKHAEMCKKRLSFYQETEKKLTEMVKKKIRPVYFLLTVRSGVKKVESELEWCKESINLIKKYGKNKISENL